MSKTFNYVDGFIIPVPRKSLAKYKKQAKLAGKVWLEHGALNYVECIGEDVPNGKITSFAKSVILKKSEVVFFCWATYQSKSHRNRVMKMVMADPRMTEAEMVIDGMRMFWGGFKPVVNL